VVLLAAACVHCCFLLLLLLLLLLLDEQDRQERCRSSRIGAPICGVEPFCTSGSQGTELAGSDLEHRLAKCPPPIFSRLDTFTLLLEMPKCVDSR
jgi:hypothetical protein